MRSCAVLVSTNASPWYQENAPGLIRTLGALMFPVGLVMIVLSGADLFTSNIMFMSVAWLHRRVTVIDVAKIWVISFFGNLGGALFTMAVMFGYGGVFTEAPAYREAAINIAVQKAVNPQWHQIFLRAIGANWLVCFAVFISISSRDIASKIIAIWWPTATFVALALDHVIANMFFIPMGMWVGAPISVGHYVGSSMIPTLIGNMVGGGLFVGTFYWYLYLTGADNIQIDFDLGSIATAMEAGGPLPRDKRTQRSSNTPVIEGVNPEEKQHRTTPPPSQHHLGVNGLFKELGDSTPYAMTHAERMQSKERSDNV